MDQQDFEIDLLEARRQKLQRLVKAGINPYPTEAVPHTALAEIKQHIEGHCPVPDSEDAKIWSAAGRLRALRGQGKIVFAEIEDVDTRLQVVCKADVLGEEQELLPNLDLGDIVWVEGSTFRTKRGEPSILAQRLVLLSKSLRPLPDKWHGLKDLETRYRQRYVDLIMDPEIRQLFIKRSQFTQHFRAGLTKHHFLEVETPVLELVPGGADANPFSTHHDTLDIELFLRISLELHLKRTLVGGLERVFEIGRVFRNEGMSPQHLQEFTMLEFYWAYADYNSLMELVESLYAEVLQATFGTMRITRKGKPDLDFTPPWPRTRYVEAIEEHSGVNVLTATDAELVEAIKKHRVDTDRSLGRARLIDQLYKKTTRPNLKPVQFLIDPPLAMSPLAKAHRDNEQLAERFWVLADGAEVGNGFSELNDPIDQKKRLEEQEQLRLAGDVEAQRLDHDFVRALEYGMPPAAGFGIGIDRLFALVTDQPSIRDVVLFPTMRPESNNREDGEK